MAVDDMELTAEIQNGVEALAYAQNPQGPEAIAAWLGLAPANEAALELLMTAAQAHRDQDNPFRRALCLLAARFIARAEDPKRPTDDRIEALCLAARADSPGGPCRGARVAPQYDVGLRRGATEVLAGAGGTGDELGPLEKARDYEVVVAIVGLLETAIRRVRSGMSPRQCTTWPTC